MANERFTQVKNVSYGLHFTVPNDELTPVYGTLHLKLQLAIKENLILDFNGPDSTLKVIDINETKDPSYQLVNGHLIIPKKYLNVGVNTISMTFQSDSRTLNRNLNYLYTLNVPNKASRIFPCFDQPDIKAVYNLSLQLPLSWTAVANAPISSNQQDTKHRNITFSGSDKISTYLFAFAAGEFQVIEHKAAGRTISLYHLETDSLKVKRNSNEIFIQIDRAIGYMQNISASIRATLSSMGITHLTPMQEEAQRVCLTPGDVILLSPTGSGKTLGFLLPLIQIIDPAASGVQALILAPSRELSLQIEQVVRKTATGFKVTCCYGGHVKRLVVLN